jgi:hypothetical protein
MQQGFLLAEDGCDRATAYHMSNKIVRHAAGTVMTWLDSQYRCIIAIVDPATGAVSHAHPISQGHDNHCGAALAVTPDGRLHAICGSHALGGFIHRHTADPTDPAAWSLPDSVGAAATYPSLLALPNGDLTLTYRHTSWSARWGMMVQRYDSEISRWTWPIQLTVSPTERYAFPTNSLALGPDGTVHVIVEYYRTPPPNTDPAGSVGVTHFYSANGLTEWHHSDTRLVKNAPVGPADAALIARHPVGDLRPGTTTVTPDGRVVCTIWNAIHGSLDLWLRETDGRWQSHELTAAAIGKNTGWKVNSQGRCTMDHTGAITVVTTVAPDRQWARPDQHIAAIRCDAATGAVIATDTIEKATEGRANWLPSVESISGRVADQPPLVLYTDGNRGDTCINDAVCGVRQVTLDF